MRCLVTGAAGFLGSHLCDRLLANGHHVTGIDDLSTGRKQNIAHIASNPRFQFVQHDVREPYSFEVDQIFNLACPASPPHYQADAIKTTLTSVLGIMHALDLAERRGARVLQGSTSEVYGDPQVHPQVESYVGHVNPVGPRACYDEGKRCAETLIVNYHAQRNVDARIVRIFNTYGPRMDRNDGRVVSNFIVQALRGEPLTIYGDGKQTRSFCYVDDLIDGIMRVMNSDFVATPVNLGNPHEITILEFVECVLAAVRGSKSKVSFKPLPVDDPTRRKPDITRASSIGFEPRTQLAEGVRRTVEYFRGEI